MRMENAPIETEHTRKEATQMRRIRTTNDSDKTFAKGIRQIVREKTTQPTRYADYELEAILRREQFEATRAFHNQSEKGCSVISLLRELTLGASRSSAQFR